MYRVVSCVVGRGCLLWPVCSLGKTLLTFALLHFVLQGEICLLLQVSLDFLLLHSSPLWWKRHLFWVLVLEGLNFPGGSDSKASAYNVGDPGSIPGSGRSPGEGNGNPLQYSCLENSTDGGAWLATVHGVAKSRIRLSDFTHFTLEGFVGLHRTIQLQLLQHYWSGIDLDYRDIEWSALERNRDHSVIFETASKYCILN